VCEKAKLIRGDPPKKKGEPLKMKIKEIFCSVFFSLSLSSLCLIKRKINLTNPFRIGIKKEYSYSKNDPRYSESLSFAQLP